MNTTTKRPVGSPTGPRPHTWQIGSDPETHAQWRVWGQTRNQAQWRGETWQLSFDEWQALWQGSWHLRGRASHNLCVTRRDFDQPWRADNVVLLTRREHGQRRVGTLKKNGYSRSRRLLALSNTTNN